jgi:protein MpaA
MKSFKIITLSSLLFIAAILSITGCSARKTSRSSSQIDMQPIVIIDQSAGSMAAGKFPDSRVKQAIVSSSLESRTDSTNKPIKVKRPLIGKSLGKRALDNKPVRLESSAVGKSVENRLIEKIVLGNGREGILFMASIHGDEAAGTSLMYHLADYLRANPYMLNGRKIMILPRINPDGIKRSIRYNARGVDLNRNFETANRINSSRHGFEALSEPETRFIVQSIRECNPKRIITFHQSAACIDYDGPGRELAVHMAKYCDLQVRKLGAMPGSLGSYAGLTLGIPTITFELHKHSDQLSPEELWEQYGTAIIASILYPEVPPYRIVKHDPVPICIRLRASFSDFINSDRAVTVAQFFKLCRPEALFTNNLKDF